MTAPMQPALVPATSAPSATAVLARSSKSFRFAGAFLPADRLQDAAVVYAFCRAVDDAVDDAPSVAAGRAAADDLAAELAGRRPARPEVRDFLAVCRKNDVDTGFADELLAGVKSDAQARVIVDDDASLLRYCYRVAGTVGGLMCGVLGVRDPRAVPFAVDLGVAMQLTNICRDVLEDARHERVYLPLARLRAAGLDVTDGVAHEGADACAAIREGAPATRDAVVVVVADLLALADRYYDSGSAGLRFIPWRSRLAILIAARVYRAIGLKLLRRGGDPLQGRTVTSTTDKLWRAAGALLSFSVLPRRLHDASLHTALRGLPGCAPEAPTGGMASGSADGRRLLGHGAGPITEVVAHGVSSQQA